MVKFAPVMKGKALLMKRTFGGNRVFRSLTEAAEELEVTPAAVSRAVNRGTLCCNGRFSWVPRIYVVKTRKGEYMVAQSTEQDDVLKALGSGAEVRKKDVAESRDITSVMWI